MFKRSGVLGAWLAIGICIGVATNSVGLGIFVGFAIGVVISVKRQ